MSTVQIGRGDTLDFELRVANDDGTPYDLTGATLRWVAYADGRVVINRTSADGISILDALQGRALVTITATAMAAVEAGVYSHEAKVAKAGRVSTVASGFLVVASSPIGATV